MKKSHAFLIFLYGVGCVTFIAVAMGIDEWCVQVIAKETSNGTDTFTRTLGVFNGLDEGYTGITGLFWGEDTYPFAMLNGGSGFVEFEAGYLFGILALCIITMLLGIMVIGVALYNMFSRPYETFAGPVGLNSYFALGLISSSGIMGLYAAAYYIELVESIPEVKPDGDFPPITTDQYKYQSGTFAISFYLVIGSAVACILGIANIIFITRQLREKRVEKTAVDNTIELKEDVIMF